MSFWRNLHYYFIAMRRQSFAAVACAQCGGNDAHPVIDVDRYLLPVHTGVCRQCSLVYTTRNISGAQLEQFYREDYRRYYETTQQVTAGYLFSHKHKLNAAYRLLRIREVVPDIGSVLEIGSGLGYFLDECRSAGVTQWMGLELGDLFRRYAQQTLGLGDAIRGEPYETIDSLPFVPQLVTLFHVFEHLEDPAGCLQWIARHIAPDGTLVIEVPDITGDWRALGLGQYHIAHRWYFSPITLSNLLAANGFSPMFMTRDDGDGIYPGNLRIIARLGKAADTYPVPTPDAASEARRIRAQIPLWSLKTGLPRGAWRLFRQALRR